MHESVRIMDIILATNIEIMGRTYVLAFGGTGAKVLESMTMLLAAGAFKNQEIVPLLIDLDWTNRNYCKAVDLIELYRSINNYAFTANRRVMDVDRFFFGSKLMKLSDIEGSNAFHSDFRSPLIIESRHLDDVLRPFNSVTSTWNSYDPLCLLTQSLYGNRMQNSAEIFDSASGINGDISITRFLFGVYGLSDDISIKELMRMVTTMDKIVVVGSVFGCSGLVGMLEMLRLFRDNNMIFRHIEKAFVLLDPYFQIEGHSSDDTFNSRSESFDRAYEGYDDVPKTTYQIHCTGRMTTREYDSRSTASVDTYAPSELAAAMAIGAFILSKHGTHDSIICDIQAGGRYDIKDLLYVNGLDSRISCDTSRALGSFSAFAYCNERYGFMENIMHDHALMHHISLYGAETDGFTSKILEFTRRYIKWWNEMAKNSYGQLDIFNFDSQSLNLIVKGKRLFNHGFLMFLGDPAFRSFQNEFRNSISYNINPDGITGYGMILGSVTNGANGVTEHSFTNI